MAFIIVSNCAWEDQRSVGRENKGSSRSQQWRAPHWASGTPLPSATAAPQSEGNSTLEARDGGKIKHMQTAQIIAQMTTEDTVKE